MRKLILSFLVVAMFCGTRVFAADTFVLPDQFGAWQAAGPSKITSGKNLLTWIAADPRRELERESGLTSMEERTYRSGDKEINLVLSTYKDPTGAYAAYTQAISSTHREYPFGDGAAFDGSTGDILIGNFVVYVGTVSAVKPEELAGLDTALRSKADHTPFPPIRTFLPDKDQVYGTQKYVTGPAQFSYAMAQIREGAFRELAKAAGFENGAEAILAKFQNGREGGILLLLEYPTPQLAEQHLHHLEQALPADAKQAGVNVERRASMLSLVLEASSKEYARKLRDEVKYETEVTWNEPGRTATDPPIVSVMVKIFLFTGLFLGVATGIGIAFGGVRVIVKRMFPGKVFDRPQDIEVLQLGLSGKKIDPTDMY